MGYSSRKIFAASRPRKPSSVNIRMSFSENMMKCVQIAHLSQRIILYSSRAETPFVTKANLFVLQSNVSNTYDKHNFPRFGVKELF